MTLTCQTHSRRNFDTYMTDRYSIFEQFLVNRGLWFTNPAAPSLSPAGGFFSGSVTVTITSEKGTVRHILVLGLTSTTFLVCERFQFCFFVFFFFASKMSDCYFSPAIHLLLILINRRSSLLAFRSTTRRMAAILAPSVAPSMAKCMVAPHHDQPPFARLRQSFA